MSKAQMPLDEAAFLEGCVGKVLAPHDETHIYQLPFAPGYAFRLMQGYGGSYSHTGTSHYCLDFAMPTGTPVCAARSGIVISVVDHFSLGGKDPALKSKWNVVRILHADRSVATYAHLMKNGACACKGQQVVAGEIVAFSGNTGWSTRPHLHFDVVAGMPPSKVPTKFAVHCSKAQFLQEGRWYSRRSPSDRLAVLQEYFSNFSIVLIRLRRLIVGQERKRAPRIAPSG